MVSFWKHVNEVLQQSDIIIEVLDARMIKDTRNREIERKIATLGKKILYVITKCDLAEKEEVTLAAKALKPSVFISSTKKLGTTILKKKIMELGRGEEVTVGVVGYPNVGKSSLINALTGRGSARTSAESGFTKGVQRIKLGTKVILLDTPGVFPEKEKNDVKHGMTSAISSERLKDPETVVLHLIEIHTGLIKAYYDVEGDEAEGILEQIAMKLKKFLRGGVPDIDMTARIVLKDWQTGKIRN